MTTEDWASIQQALEVKFSGGTHNAVGGKWLAPLLEEEGLYGAELVRTYKGFAVLKDAFFDFYIETLNLAAVGAFQGQLSKTDRYYAIIYISFLSIFRGLRAACTLKNYGYPLRGFSLLRDQNNQAIYIGAVFNGLTNILAIHGLDAPRELRRPITQIEYDKIRTSRAKEQRRAMSLMVGKDSGLKPEDIFDLEKRRDMYHEEVHGSRFSFFEDCRTIFKNNEITSISPQPHSNNTDIFMYMNRFCEVELMVLRVLPFL